MMTNIETSFSPQIYAENADHKTIGADVAGCPSTEHHEYWEKGSGMPNMETSFSPQIYAENADHKTIGADVAGCSSTEHHEYWEKGSGWQTWKRLSRRRSTLRTL